MEGYRVIVIDAHTETVRECRIFKLSDYYREMRCNRIQYACNMDVDTHLMVDEEKLINGTAYVGFCLNNLVQWRGSGILSATDEEGELTDLSEDWTVEKVKQNVSFWGSRVD